MAASSNAMRSRQLASASSRYPASVVTRTSPDAEVSPSAPSSARRRPTVVCSRRRSCGSVGSAPGHRASTTAARGTSRPAVTRTASSRSRTLPVGNRSGPSGPRSSTGPSTSASVTPPARPAAAVSAVLAAAMPPRRSGMSRDATEPRRHVSPSVTCRSLRWPPRSGSEVRPRSRRRAQLRTTTTVQRGPGAPASRASAVTRSTSSASASAT